MSQKLLEQAEVKATTTAVGSHVIEFYALAFSKEADKQGDRIDPDAVDEWLAKFYAAGKPLPISFTHAAMRDTTDPFNIVGYAPADPEHVWKDDHGLRVRAFLETEINDKAEQVYRLTKRGVVSGASVAYIAEEEKLQKDGSTLITRMSVLEAGPCLDPANPDAFVISVKSVIGSHQTPTSEESWDAAANVARISNDAGAAVLRRMYAWVDSDGDPSSKASYKFPHHNVSSDGAVGPANLAACSNGIAVLNGGRGGASIADADRRGVWGHLAAHLRAGDREAPELKADDPDAATADILPDGTVTVTVTPALKAGRVISAANESKLRQIRETIDEILSALGPSETKASEPEAANDEEPSAKSEEPSIAELRQAIAAAES